MGNENGDLPIDLKNFDGYIVDPPSKLKSLVGRRFPLLVILAVLFLVCINEKQTDPAGTLLGIIGILAKGYFDDIKQEKMGSNLIACEVIFKS